MISTSVLAGGFEFEEENYINDIPFNTAEVYQDVIISGIAAEFDEEVYVDDIPFNTVMISEKLMFEEAMDTAFDFEEEKYINDIPFNTAAISQNIQLQATTCAK